MLNINDLEGIFYREWKTDAPSTVFLLVHGLGGHSGRWEFLAEYFLKNNIFSYAIELKGFGETKSLKSHIDSLNTYLNDMRSLYHLIKKENPNKKIFILGESMGGLLAFQVAGCKEVLFSGAICLSPAFKSRVRFSIIEYMNIFLNYLINPKKTI